MGTDLITINAAQYPALDPTGECVQTMLANLGGESLSAGDFAHIKVPAGGAIRWQLESSDNFAVLDLIEGVILSTSRRRAYWSNPNPSQNPPDCTSADMFFGNGSPGGDCLNCPFNTFGSAANGHGKACREARVFFVLRPGKLLPDILVAPPASLRAAKRYLVDLGQRQLPYWMVVTSFGLERATNRDGTAYSRILIKSVGTLDANASVLIRRLIDEYTRAGVFAAVDIRRDDTAEAEGGTV
jgi:hypothetical protein